MRKRNNEETTILSNDPFLAGRTEAAERYGYLAKNAAQWRMISLILAALCALCVIMTVHTATRATVVPFIVQVDQHGFEIAVSPVAPADVDGRLIMARLARYVSSLKTVYNSTQAQLDLMSFVHHTTAANSPAQARFMEFYEINNPMDIANTHTIFVTVNSILPLGDNMWQAEWTTRGLSITGGTELFRRQYRGIFGVTVYSPTSMREVLTNPLGIFVTDFNFSEIIAW